MLYRQLTEADIERYVALESYAFRSNPDRTQLTPEKLAHFRGLFVADELAAQLEIIPLLVQTGQGAIAAAGVGSVASTPELRRRGYVEALLRQSCDEWRAGGVPLAVLYPFKRAFYGRYGWATFMERRVYSGAPALFANVHPGPGGRSNVPPGRFYAAGPEQIAELDTIYRGALRGRFGPIVRDEHWWRTEVLQGWDRKPYHAYIWRDEQGRGRSYTIFRFGSNGSSRTIECREMVALDATARAQLFGFLAGHESQIDLVRFRAPADAPVNLLFAEPLECTIEPHFMLRLVDVPAALAGYGFPSELHGHFTIAVADDWIAENNAVFSLEIGDGKVSVSRLPAGSPADLSCDVRVLAQIYSRYLRPRTAATFGVLDVANRQALTLADRAFAGLTPFNSDFF